MTKIFHYTFRTYKKRRVLIGDIAADLGVLFQEICEAKGFKLISSSILADHVHLLISKGTGDSNEYVMKMIKGISSREIFKKYPSNRFEFRKLWGRGYHAVGIKDQESLERTMAYIYGQKIEGVDKRALRGRKPANELRGFLPRMPRWIGNRDVQSQVSNPSSESRVP